MNRRSFFKTVAGIVAVAATSPLVKAVAAPADPLAACSLPFRVLPSSIYIRGVRYRVKLQAIGLPRLKDQEAEQRTWQQVRDLC